MVNVLFARKDSVYKTLGCEVWDIDRDARNYCGNLPVVCHPPCRLWGKLSGFSKAPADEKDLAFFAIDTIRRCGGVLEHPNPSKLFPTYLPLPGRVDEHGGYTISIDQFWFGHKAKKSTFLYICGCDKKDLPIMPIRLDAISHYICYPRSWKGKSRNGMKEVTRAEREHTPIALAKWLLQVAELCGCTHS